MKKCVVLCAFRHCTVAGVADLESGQHLCTAVSVMRSLDAANGRAAGCCSCQVILPRRVAAQRLVARPSRTCSSSNGTANTSSGSADELQPAQAPQGSQQRPAAINNMPSSLNLAFESMEKTSKAIKTTGLRRAPLSGGVKNATQRFDLPSPCVAVRNLVEQAQFAHLCTVMSHMHHR